MANSGITVEKKSVGDMLQSFKDKKIRCFSLVFNKERTKVVLGPDEPLPFLPKGAPICSSESVMKKLNIGQGDFRFYLMYCRCSTVASTSCEPEFRDDPVLVKFFNENACPVKLKMIGASSWSNVKKYVESIGKIATVEVSDIGELDTLVFDGYIGKYNPVGKVVEFEGHKVVNGKLCQD